MSAPTLQGRAREFAALDGRLASARERGSAVVVRGEAGAGKTALLEAVRRGAVARGLTTLTGAGFRSEAHIAFAGLHRLLRPVLADLDRVARPQRAAIRAAFGLDESPAPDLFLIALATLDLLSEAAARTPLLLLVDDAEDLDVATCDVLTFVARRLECEPIVLLFAVRDGSTARITEAALPELRLGPLDAVAAAAVLDLHAGGLPADARRRILAEAVGNPLALVELPRAVPEGFDPASVTPLPMTERLERAFAGHLAVLPVPVRTLLLVAALDDGGDQERIFGAASLLGHPVGAAEVAAAQAARALRADGDGLRFRHPLIRSAVYRGALTPDRRAAHRALADVYAAEPDRGVWHAAASSAGPDDRIATELEALAGRAAGRGALAVAVTALARAGQLTSDDARRGRLLLRAAWLAHDLGQLAVSSRLLRDAQHLALAEPERTMLRYLIELGHDDRWSGAPGIRRLVDVSGRLSALGEVEHALNALVSAAVRCWWENPDQETRDLVAAAADRLPVPADSPRLLAVLAQADPERHGRLALERIAGATPDPTDPVGMYLLGLAANAVWAYDLGLVFLSAAVDGLRAQGRLRLLAQALAAQAWAAVHCAREPLAVSAAEEASTLARDTGQPRWAVAAQLATATIAAERGDVERVETLTREAEAMILPMGATPMLALVQFARGRGAVAHQHYAQGYEHLRRVLDPADPAYHPFIGAWGLSDLVEATAHSDRTAAASAYLDRLESLATRTSGSMLQATLGYARAMVAADADAEPLFTRALGHDLVDWPCYRGRLLLWYGRWLRRQRRVAESRPPLRAALDGFDALAFPALARSARQELRASGEKHEPRGPDGWARLTPQELQIARMASAGDTNRAIAEQLYLSPRTVQSHLYRIFPKLGVTARNQLRDAFAGRDPV